MSRSSSAPCPQCRAKNFTYRRLCWKCGKTLPTSFALEGTQAYSSAQSVADDPVERAVEGLVALAPAQPAADGTGESAIAMSMISERASTGGNVKSSCDSSAAIAKAYQPPANRGKPESRMEFRELVRGLLEKSGIY